MITIFPSVQFGCKRARRQICESANGRRVDKRFANRRHRRALNRITRAFMRDPERFYGEDFAAPTWSAWDVS